jgi:ferredoxin--NADP+ reductase
LIEQDVLQLDEEECGFLELPANAAIKRNVGVISDAASRGSDREATKELHLNFLASPVAIEGADRVEAVHFVRNRLEGPVACRRAVPSGERFSISAGLTIASIGFQGRPLGDVPFDERRGIIPNVEGRVTGDPIGGASLYVAGWIKRGATGIIGTNRADAAETVRTLLADFRDKRWSVKTDRQQAIALSGNPRIDFADWRRIDEAECRSGREVGRPRRKIVSIEAMLDIARSGEAPATPSQPAA